MSDFPGNEAKSKLNKHINSKLFQRFLQHNSVKSLRNDSKVRKSLNFQSKNSPGRTQINNESSEEDPIPFNQVLNNSGNRDFSLQRSRKISPIDSKELSPFQARRIFRLESPKPLVNRHKSLEKLRNSMGSEKKPIFTVDPLLITQYHTRQNELQMEIGKIKLKFEETLRGKNNEIRRLEKNNEKMQGIHLEFVEKLRKFEENERKMMGLRVEREGLERKILGIESECENLRRQLEYARETIENLKIQMQDQEKNYKYRCQDKENELKTSKDRCEDLERQLYREKTLRNDIESKLHKVKNSKFRLENDLSRSNTNLRRADLEIQELQFKFSSEKTQRLKESEKLWGKIENLSKSHRFSEEASEFQSKSQRDLAKPSDFSENPFNLSIPPKSSILQKSESLKTIENTLYTLSINKRTLENELAKIPSLGKRLFQIHRQEQIENELESLNKNISLLKYKQTHLNFF